MAKLMLNSLWGKFAQRANFIQSKTCTSVAEYRKLEMKWDTNEIDIVYKHFGAPNAKNIVETLVLYRQFTENEDSGKNIAIAAFVTANARMRLWTELNKLDKRVLYHDTDSIIYEHDPALYNIPCGKYLGEWEDECDGKPITAFVSTGPKTYAYKYLNPPENIDNEKLAQWRRRGDEFEFDSSGAVRKVTYECKAKGFTLNHKSAEQINFAGMHSLLIKSTPYLEALAPMFVYSRESGITTHNAPKLLKWSYNKGHVTEDFNVLPNGYESFSAVVVDGDSPV